MDWMCQSKGTEWLNGFKKTWKAKPWVGGNCHSSAGLRHSLCDGHITQRENQQANAGTESDSNQMNLTDSRAAHPRAAEHTLSLVHVEHSPGQTGWQTPNKSANCKRWSPPIFSDHNGMELVISENREAGKSTHMWEVNSTLLKNNRVRERKRDIS